MEEGCLNLTSSQSRYVAVIWDYTNQLDSVLWRLKWTLTLFPSKCSEYLCSLNLRQHWQSVWMFLPCQVATAYWKLDDINILVWWPLCLWLCLKLQKTGWCEGGGTIGPKEEGSGWQVRRGLGAEPDHGSTTDPKHQIHWGRVYHSRKDPSAHCTKMPPRLSSTQKWAAQCSWDRSVWDSVQGHYVWSLEWKSLSPVGTNHQILENNRA